MLYISIPNFDPSDVSHHLTWSLTVERFWWYLGLSFTNTFVFVIQCSLLIWCLKRVPSHCWGKCQKGIHLASLSLSLNLSEFHAVLISFLHLHFIIKNHKEGSSSTCSWSEEASVLSSVYYNDDERTHPLTSSYEKCISQLILAA